MADKLGHAHLPKLEDLCVNFIRANVNCWKPENFLGIPRHLLFPILEKLDPLEIEKLQVSGIFQTMAIDTDALWRDLYTARWPRKSKWPEVYSKTKEIMQEQEQWRVYYLQRHLQETLNISGCHDLHNTVSVCGKYAAYLRLYNPACIYLAKNWDIFLQLAEFVEFLEVFLLRDNGVDSLCHLLQAFASKRLKSIGFCFCKVGSVHLWNRIIGSLSQVHVCHQNGSSITGLEKNLTVEQKNEVLAENGCDNVKSHVNQACRMAPNGTSAGGSTNENEAGSTCHLNIVHVDDLDIYDFADSSDNHLSFLPSGDQRSRSTDEEMCTVRSDRCLHQPCTLSETSTGISSDLYDEVFGCCNCEQSIETPKELIQINQGQQKTDLSPDQYQTISKAVRPQSQLLSLSNGCSLVHFELVAFWLHQDLIEMFVNSLKHWLNLESLTLEDNGLGLPHPSSSQKFMDTLFFLCSNGQLRCLKITNNLVRDSDAKFLVENMIGSFCSKCNLSSKSLTKLTFSSFQVSEAFSVHVGRAIKDCCSCKSRNLPCLAKVLEPLSSTSKSRTTDGKNLTQKDCTKLTCSCCACLHSPCRMNRRKTKSVTHAQEKLLESVSSSIGFNTNSDVTLDCVIKKTCSCVVGLNVSCDNGSCCIGREKVLHHIKAVSDHENLMYNDTAINSDKPGSHVTTGINCKDMPSADSSQDLSQRSLSFSCCNFTAFVGIQELRLTCPIGDGGASLIADGLQRNSSLNSLSLVKCDISTAGLGDIFQALSGNKTLKHLSVKGNRYDLGNNDNLAEMLASNNTLTNLDLGSCKLGEHVTDLGVAIIDALCINSTLTNLKLDKNRLGDAHIAALSHVFTHPMQISRITKLDLSNNPISLECLSVFASSLQSIRPRKLDELRLTGNILGSKSHQVLSSLRSVVHSVIAEHMDKATLFADFISQM